MWLAELARRRALETPDRVAYSSLDRSLAEAATLTYAELDRRASAIAAGIVARTSPRARVLLLVPSGLDFVVAVFACLYASRTIVPGLPPRRRDPPAQARIRAILNDARPELVIADAELAADLFRPPWVTQLPAGMRAATPEELGRAAPNGVAPLQDDNELTLLQYTSGSTSDPRGAMISEAALHSNLRQIQQRFEHTPATRAVMWVPMHHDMGLVGGVFEPMHSGFPTALMSAFDFAQRPSRWLQAISRYGVTASGGPTFGYRMCVERIRDDQLEDLQLSSWKLAFVGAERVSASVMRAFAARFARYGFDESALLPCYGLAENTLMATSRTKASGLTVSGATEHVSCGAPVAGHELRIVDAVSRRLCAEGEVGEVWLRGPSTASGYWGKPDLSEQTFGAMDSGGAGPYLRTGDLGFLRDGELFITGRLKETVVVRGVKHAPEDIEATVAASHACFRSATIVAFAFDAQPEERLVIACEVRRSAWSEREIESALAAALEAVVRAHDVRPHAVVLVKPGAVPRTTSGKVQRVRCRELFERGAFAPQDGSSLEVSR